MKPISNQVKTFLLGLSASILILVGFFAGAMADRLFVIKPLDVLTGKARVSVLRNQLASDDGQSKLGTMLATQSSVADVAEVASESVVTVAIKTQQPVMNNFNPFGLGFFSLPSGETEEVQRDIGTGFVVGDDSLIVTNKHVVGDAQATYLVIDKENNEYTVSEIYRDPANDLAILKADGFDVPALPLGDSEQLRVGEDVIAIGTALGEFRHTVTTGVVSGLGRGVQAIDPSARAAEDLEGLIQTDAAINPGNSGGPLLDRSGQVIGVNVAVSAGAENIGFALPINIVKTSLENFTQTGSFERPFLGVSYRMITEQAALFNEVPQGAYVLSVVKGSTAADAGLQEGDIITNFAGEKLQGSDLDLATVVNKHRVGEQVSLEYWRDGQRQAVEVVLKTRSD